jgi:hypothetical protein
MFDAPRPNRLAALPLPLSMLSFQATVHRGLATRNDTGTDEPIRLAQVRIKQTDWHVTADAVLV